MLQNYRKTPVRDKLIELFAEGLLLSVSQMQDLLKFSGLIPNKTTLYREIEFLMGNSVIQEVELGDGKKRYERTSGEHHHHLVCTICKAIDDVALESDLDSFEKNIEDTKKFKVTRHSLEFFGICNSCQK